MLPIAITQASQIKRSTGTGQDMAHLQAFMMAHISRLALENSLRQVDTAYIPIVSNGSP